VPGICLIQTNRHLGFKALKTQNRGRRAFWKHQEVDCRVGIEEKALEGSKRGNGGDNNKS